MKKEAKVKNNKQVPIVSILGHVDHGKTTLLDYIRESRVQAKEAGGITQKISVFTVKPRKEKEDLITFIDTPGHEAFDLMRYRGGNIADIVLLVVAADDGVKPQTVESIEIIKKSSVKPIVVITKTDLGKENVSKIKRDLSTRGLLVEGMGGDTPIIEVSAKTGEGIPELLDMINLVIEIEGFKKGIDLPENVRGKAFVLESVKDKFKGNVVTFVVVEGDFVVGDWFVYQIDNKIHFERIKALLTEDDLKTENFSKGFGGKVIGISQPVNLGTEVYCFTQKDEDLAKELFDFEVKEEVEESDEKKVEDSEEIDQEKILADFFDEEKSEGEEKEFRVFVKSSSEGSLEAIKKSIEKISVEGVKIKIIGSGIGNISVNDVELASVSKAIVLGFEVSFEKGVEDLAKKNKVFVKTYDIIYKLIEEIKDAAETLVAPTEVEDEIGNAEVKQIFVLSDKTQVIGCKGVEGVVRRGEKAYIVRDDDIIAEGKIVSMKSAKKDIKEGTKGSEFGVVLAKSVPNIEVGDILYCFAILK